VLSRSETTSLLFVHAVSVSITDDHGCKVCRVLAERELGHYDERLLAEWRGEEGPRKGYRSLAEWLN